MSIGALEALMETEEIVRMLDEITLDTGDPEQMHAEADGVLLLAVDPEVRDAYNRVVRLAGWWAYA